MSRPLRLPRHLEQAIWEHARRQLPGECVGVVGADEDGALVAVYPLANVAARPERCYVADPTELLRALKAMRHSGLTLGAIYHSHPHGPAVPSATDLSLAEYPVPYLIADVEGRVLRAYLLPQNLEIAIEVS